MKFRLNGPAFARGLVLGFLTPRAQALCEEVGPARFGSLMDRGQHLRDYLAALEAEEREFFDAIISLAPRYAWAADAITDDDLLRVLPPWLLTLAAQRGPAGQAWVQDELRWLRSLFGGVRHATDPGLAVPPPAGAPDPSPAAPPVALGRIVRRTLPRAVPADPSPGPGGDAPGGTQGDSG